MFGLFKKLPQVFLVISALILVTVTSCGSNTVVTENNVSPDISVTGASAEDFPAAGSDVAASEDLYEKQSYIIDDHISMTDVYSGVTESGQDLSADILSIGGGGMLFSPKISPHDPNLFTALADMGGMYISYDAGESWERRFFRNVVYTSCFDPNRENVIYAGGAGLYRSTDNGASFHIIFPKEEDVLELHNNGGKYDVQIYTESGIYPTYFPVCSVLVNPQNSDNIFVAAGYGRECMVYESIDNGQSFAQLGTCTKEKYNTGGSVYELTDLFYAVETGDLYLGIEDGIFRLNRETGLFEEEFYSMAGLVDIASFFKDNSTWFIYLEKNDPHEKSSTGIYATVDFNTIMDLTDTVTANLSTSFSKFGYLGEISFQYAFNHIEAADLNRIFLTSVSRPSSASYPYSICAVLYYNGETTDWVYGNPYKDADSIENPGYYNDDTTCYGIAVDWEIPGRFIETSQGGILYSPDGDRIYQLASNVTEVESNTFYDSRGIDEHVVYKVVEDPFDAEHLMMLTTDWGLQESFDGGITFRLCHQGIPQNWRNTAYDLAFNKKRKGLVYSIWSGNHSGTRNYIDSLETLHGGFACSYDGGQHWDTDYSTGLPEDCLPVEMSIVYMDDSNQVTIYLATHMHGFYVSYDSGRTFSPINEGLEEVRHESLMGVPHTCIPATDIETADGRVFGIIENVSDDPLTSTGRVYELIDGLWREIDVRSYEDGQYASLPVDINCYDGKVFINYISYPIYLESDIYGYCTNHGGGVLCWDGDRVIQIFDETCPTTGLQMSSDGRIYVSDYDGNLYRKKQGDDWEILYRHFHIAGAEIQLYENHKLYFTTSGGGALCLSGPDL